MIIFLTKDLMIQSSASAAARPQGVPVVSVPSVTRLVEKAITESPVALFIDLQTPGLDISELIESLNTVANKPPTIAFAQHVEEELLALAKSDAIQSVITRGQFSNRLPQLIEQFASAAGG